MKGNYRGVVLLAMGSRVREKDEMVGGAHELDG